MPLTLERQAFTVAPLSPILGASIAQIKEDELAARSK